MYEFRRYNTNFSKKKTFRKIRKLYLLVSKFQVTLKFLAFYNSIKPINSENFRTTLNGIEMFHNLKSISKEFSEIDYLILDEGILHRLWSASLHGKISSQSQRELERLVHFISKNLNIINIHSYIDRKVAVERINNRSTFGSRLDKMNTIEVSDLLKFNEYNQKFLHQVISSDKDIYTISVDGSETIKEKLNKVIEKIEK